MIEKLKQSKKAQLITACFLILALSVSAIAFGWFAWALPNVESNEPAPEALLADASAPAAEEEEQPEPEAEAEEALETEEAAQEQEPVSLPEGEESGYLTVGLYSSCSSVPNRAVSEISISCSDGFLLCKKLERGWTADMDLRAYTSFVVRLEEGSVNLYDEAGSLVLCGLCTDDILMSAAEDADSRIVTIGSYEYRDGVMFKAESQTAMTVINFVGMEHYLWGCVNLEMDSSNPVEALKAQSVACRCYALSRLGYHGKYGFDLCTSDNCQTYRGCRAEAENTTQACRDTAGIVMSYDGKIASGFYFSNSGGYTMNSEDVWTSKVPYLRAVQDGYADFTQWNFTVSFESLQQKLLNNGYDVGELQSVAVTATYDNGTIKTMTFTGTGGSVSLPGNKLASYLYADSTHYAKSKIYCIGDSDYPIVSLGSGSISKTVYTIGGEISLDEFYVMTDEGPVQVSQPTGLYVTKANSIVPLLSTTETTDTQYPLLQNEVVTSGTVYVTGFGYGHGVGMSQISAINMAKAGKTWTEILEYFYTDIDFVDDKSLQE